MYHAIRQGQEVVWILLKNPMNASTRHERKISDDFHKANRYIWQNREGTAQVLSEWFKIDNEMAAATYDSIAEAFNDDGSLRESGLRILIDKAKRDSKITRDVTSNEVADLSILLEAQREREHHTNADDSQKAPKSDLLRSRAMGLCLG